ncbi:hypothetical protein [Marinobacterium maritimum]
MFNKTAITLGALVIMALVLTKIVSNWMQNPYGLEPERLGPKGSETIPPVTALPNAKNYLLYPYYDDNAYVIHLALPNHYIHPSNTTERVLKSYGVSASMYYPGLNGKFHPENANLPNCNGYCAGYVRASIEPSRRSAHEKNRRILERIAHDRQQDSALYQFEDLDAEFGVDEHFQIRYPVIEAKSKGSMTSTQEYLISRDPSGDVQYLFECLPYTPSPACEVEFNLSTMPELVINIRFSRSLMTEWPKIVRAVNDKVASWKPVKIETVKE